MIAIEIRGLVKRFEEVEALKGISADIESGRLTGLVGPDGAGKTTLIQLIAALRTPTEGTIRVESHSTVGLAASVREDTGYMPQKFGLYEELTVMENLKLYARLRSMDSSKLDSTFAELLHFTRLEPFVNRRAGRLSGGMKQKLGLACALMARPAVLLLDEPSVGVDPVSRQDLWRMVQKLTHDGMAVVWSTAYLDEAERCDTVLLLNDGRIEFDGPPQQLTARVSGRSYRLVGLRAKRRAILAQMLDLPGVRDGVIQGDALRAVLDEGASSSGLSELTSTHGGTLEHAPASFEDAFIDLLGGGPGGRSAIAERMEPVADLGVRRCRVVQASDETLRRLRCGRRRELRRIERRNIRTAGSERCR